MQSDDRRLIRSRFPAFFVAPLILSSLMLAGCGGDPPGSDKPRGEISITVTYGGQPVTEGSVDLANPQTGEGGGGELDDEGTASISNVAHGEYTVLVVPPPTAPLVPGQTPPPRKEYPNIPQKFRDIATSPLKAEITGESAELAFDLKELE